jgi:hypothetical protein
VGTLLQIDERHHTYRIIVLERFPVFFNEKEAFIYYNSLNTESVGEA